MRVIEIVIDGFKSYAVRTVISGWDESFNSITGLNGSGKSNILDAICFVLGIQNMSTVRAQNLQDLIYKRGQAGVTKASVTIVFDNLNKKKSPIGFEEYAQISVTRQIVLGGTSKYLINGHRAQQQTVQNLFQSVQLNINNPNFLIMQGRITKVLNMKAVEILAMIEEAAGTRMYEDRRDKAIKSMAKKELKVNEIRDLLAEEIDPKLDRLRQEKRAFLDFQQTQNDVERLTKMVVAHDYIRGNTKVDEAKAEMETKRSRITAIEESAIRLKNEINLLQEDIRKIREQREKEMRKGGKFQALEAEFKEHSHEVVRLTTVIDLKKSGIAEEQEKSAALQNTIKDLEKSVKQKQSLREKLKEKYDSAYTALASQSDEVEKKEELLQTLQTGVASREGERSGYQGQLQDARNRVSAATTQQEQAKIKVSNFQDRIKEEEPKAAKAQKANAGLLKELDGLRSHVTKLEAELSKLGINSDSEQEMLQEESRLQQQIGTLREQADAYKRKVAGIDFTYSDPSPNFDRSRVKGLVAQLFSLDQRHVRAGTALEVCAGGRLYNVVVDSAETGAALLQGGKLRKRVTIIPLNKIAAFRASAQKVGAAQKIAPGKVDLALSLVGYDKEVTAAMEYVFGSTFICDDATSAKQVTFDPAVKLRSVTLDGDVYDPSGTLSGGSAPQSSGVLVTLQKLNEVTTELTACERDLLQLQSTMAREKKKLDGARQLKQELDLKTHEVTLTEQQINSNSSSTIIQAVTEMRASIEQLKGDIASAKAEHAEASKEVKRVEKEMREFNDNKDSKLAELQGSLDKLKKALTKANSAIKPLQQEMREATIEAEQYENDLTGAQEQLIELQAGQEALNEEIEALIAEQKQAKDAHDIAQAHLQDEQARLSSFDSELKDLETAIRLKNTQTSEEALEQQRLGHQLEKVDKERHSAMQSLRALSESHDWIDSEKDQFGRPGSAYDFRSQNMIEAKVSLKSLNERFLGMKKKINPKVMNMIDSVEKKEASLKNMMRTVIKDKKKIEDTIVELDRYKIDALQKTWEKVNGDFGSIFNELLPGSFAKLDPPEGKTIAEGLEVKVCLGKVWKQSLTELSGGQRSLIALSLIMALLQFKPAPMYILDEVDAALDLSHTQNIGRLIKTRFLGSQFIVVSLKDGMFQNANRIFRTRFVDGTSTVQALTPADMK